MCVCANVLSHRYKIVPKLCVAYASEKHIARKKMLQGLDLLPSHVLFPPLSLYCTYFTRDLRAVSN